MIFVTGANGSVGSYICDVFSAKQVHLTDIDQLDVTNLNLVKRLFNEIRPETVIHLAAETDVDRCELEPDRAFRTNALGTENIAIACRNTNTLMVYVSTGAVFEGSKKEPYTEFDLPTNPVNVYGRSKLEGERAVQSILKRYFIVRASWMIGGGQRDKKFVYKILQLMNEKKRIQIVSDKFGTITYGKHLLQGVRDLITTERYGIYHVGNGGVVSRLDVARELLNIMNKPVEILPVTSDAFPLPAPRPRLEAIRNYKLELLGRNNIPDWKSALAEYIQELEKLGILLRSPK